MKYKLVIEKSGETAVMAFTEDNIIKDTFTYGYGKAEQIINKLNVKWFSALEANNPQRLAWAEDELDQEINGVKEDSIEAYGIIRQSQALRLAKKILYDRKLGDIWCEFESNMSAMHCEPFDIISVTHSRPKWSAALFRIIEIAETAFGRAKYTCIAYNSSILDDREGATIDDWDYSSTPGSSSSSSSSSFSSSSSSSSSFSSSSSSSSSSSESSSSSSSSSESSSSSSSSSSESSSSSSSSSSG